MKTSAAWGLSAMRSMRAMCLRCRAVGEVSLETRQMAFHLAYVLLSGDGTIAARLASANSTAQAGSDDPRNADGNFQRMFMGSCARSQIKLVDAIGFEPITSTVRKRPETVGLPRNPNHCKDTALTGAESELSRTPDAAAKIASSPCPCQDSMSNERSGKPRSTSRVFHSSILNLEEILIFPLRSRRMHGVMSWNHRAWSPPLDLSVRATIQFPLARRQTFESPDQRWRLERC